MDVLDGSTDDEGGSNVGDPATGRSGQDGGGNNSTAGDQAEPAAAAPGRASTIKVALRVRPALPRELFHPSGFRTVADPATESGTIRVLPPTSAPRHRQATVSSSFDRVFGIEVRDRAGTAAGSGKAGSGVAQRPLWLHAPLAATQPTSCMNWGDCVVGSGFSGKAGPESARGRRHDGG